MKIRKTGHLPEPAEGPIESNNRLLKRPLKNPPLLSEGDPRQLKNPRWVKFQLKFDLLNESFICVFCY